MKLNELMDVSLYDWYVDELDGNFYIFREGKYEKKEFKESLDDLGLLSFARIRRYPAGVPIQPIETYSGFCESKCDLLILLYDGGFYEIYSKDSSLTHSLFQASQKAGCSDAEYITDENDGRTCMYY